MLSGADYAAWSVKALLWVGGAASTVVGSWFSSWLSNKTQIYYHVKSAHRDELVQKVLNPLRDFLRSQPEQSPLNVDWKPQSHNSQASAQEYPTTFGLMVVVEDPGGDLLASLDEALFEDTRVHHYPDLIADFETFKSALSAHLLRRKEWIERMAQRILSASGLSPHPNSGPYVIQLSLAKFVYNRLLETQDSLPTNLTARQDGGDFLLTDNSTNFAKGTQDTINYLLTFINDLLTSERPLATEIGKEREQLETTRNALSRRFSLAMAAKRLKARCPLVSFFGA